MVNKIFTAMFLISVVAFAPAAAWAHTGHHHHHHHHHHHTIIKSNSGDKR